MRNPQPTPDHVVFSETLLAVPPLPSLLGQIHWPIGGELIAEEGNWTKEGDVIAKFRVRPMVGLGPRFGEIRSPIPGRILTIASNPFKSYDPSSREFTNFYFIIEVPKGVTCPHSLSRTFHHFCTSVLRQQAYLFDKCREKYFPRPTEEEIIKVLDGLLNSKPVLLSKKEDNYQAIIDSLNFRHPHGIGRGKY